MASFVKYQCFVGDLGLKAHDLNADQLNVMLTNSAPNAATHAVKADVTQVANGGGYTTDGADTQNTYSQSGGTGSCVGTDVVFTATTGFGPFRYVVLFNKTTATGLLVGYWDYGSSITLAAGETFTTDFGATLFTIV